MWGVNVCLGEEGRLPVANKLVHIMESMNDNQVSISSDFIFLITHSCVYFSCYTNMEHFVGTIPLPLGYFFSFLDKKLSVVLCSPVKSVDFAITVHGFRIEACQALCGVSLAFLELCFS